MPRLNSVKHSSNNKKNFVGKNYITCNCPNTHLRQVIPFSLTIFPLIDTVVHVVAIQGCYILTLVWGTELLQGDVSGTFLPYLSYLQRVFKTNNNMGHRVWLRVWQLHLCLLEGLTVVFIIMQENLLMLSFRINFPSFWCLAVSEDCAPFLVFFFFLWSHYGKRECEKMR